MVHWRLFIDKFYETLRQPRVCLSCHRAVCWVGYLHFFCNVFAVLTVVVYVASNTQTMRSCTWPFDRVTMRSWNHSWSWSWIRRSLARLLVLRKLASQSSILPRQKWSGPSRKRERGIFLGPTMSSLQSNSLRFMLTLTLTRAISAGGLRNANVLSKTAGTRTEFDMK